MGAFEIFNQENMYKAFQSKLFVDDCDLNVKIKALSEIRSIHKAEAARLMEVLA